MDTQEAPKRNRAAARSLVCHPDGQIDREQGMLGLEVATAVASKIGAQRTGFRISPSAQAGRRNEGGDLYRHLVTELDKLKLAYLHLIIRATRIWRTISARDGRTSCSSCNL